ncbi:MAG: immunoglobulin domain-containing protein, partial [Prosthecobacter sp.]|nr:immunoglobulin domain-containing protein [Prosthecobacter sp.]
LRVLPALGGPTLVTGAEVGDRKVGLNDPMVISLAGRFRDADTTAAVRMTTTKGSLDISLYNNLTPQAFNNFVTYAAAGDYNQMTFHRLERNFVLQGGFLRAVSAPRVFTRVNARPSPPNEPGISNVFGTIAAAKLGERTSYSRDQLGQIVRDSSGNPVVRPASAAMGYVGNPNSASIDFFFNLADNRENLDNQNGGFTVFGRVGTPGHTLLQQINQLPIGSYQNANPAGSAYNASLDRRIIIDGSLVPLSGIPMDATTAPVDMDIEKTIRVTGIQPIPSVSYSVDSQATNIATVAVEGTNLRVTGLAAGTRPVVLTATTSFNIIVTPGYKRPVITRQPVSATARAGSTVRYSVTATGTSLNYRWRKNGTVIAGQTGQGSPSFTVVSAQVSDEGEYDVVVYNDAESVFSAKARLDIIKAPVITGTLPNKLVEAGKELKLEANLTEGSPAPTFTWRRGASVVPRQTTRTLLIPAASLADAGVYQATARNSVASATTTQATVVVIDKRERKQVEPPGSTVRLVAQAQGADLLYQWYRVLDNGSRQDIPGAEDPILQLSNLNPATDAGSYACEITLPLGIDPVEKHSTGITFLAVSGRPQIADTLTLADAVVGATYNNLPNYGFNGSNNALTFNILGLPPGLVYDKNTGRITGRPTRPGDYRVTFTATNKSGTSPAVIRSIRVFSMGSGLSGTFIANVSASDALNGGKGGRLNLSVTSSGAYTATLQMAKDQFRATGSMVLVNVVTDENGLTNKVYLGSATLPRRGRSSLSLTFQIVERSQSFSGFVSDGSQSADFSGHRLVWSSSFRQGPLIMVASQRYQDPLRHNVLLSLPDTLTSRTDLPQGDGYLSA